MHAVLNQLTLKFVSFNKTAHMCLRPIARFKCYRVRTEVHFSAAVQNLLTEMQFELMSLIKLLSTCDSFQLMTAK